MFFAGSPILIFVVCPPNKMPLVAEPPWHLQPAIPAWNSDVLKVLSRIPAKAKRAEAASMGHFWLGIHHQLYDKMSITCPKSELWPSLTTRPRALKVFESIESRG